jgi:hypothetical protein
VEILRRSDESEVETAYLRAELDSPRFRDEVLSGRRGWRIGGLYDGFPDELEWHRVALSADEVLEILYIDWDWWLTLSGGTRSPREAARWIRAGLVAGADAESHRPLAARLHSEDPPPELIAVAEPDLGKLVLVEGHWRLTAYALYPEYLPERLELFVGVSAEIDRWPEF